MLAAIPDARTSITFESFMYWSGTIGRKFADALVERARAGVKVHVLLDFSRISKRLAPTRNAGSGEHEPAAACLLSLGR